MKATLSTKHRLCLHLDDVLDILRTRLAPQGLTIGETCLRVDVDHAGRAITFEWTEDIAAPKQVALPGTGGAK